MVAPVGPVARPAACEGRRSLGSARHTDITDLTVDRPLSAAEYDRRCWQSVCQLLCGSRSREFPHSRPQDHLAGCTLATPANVQVRGCRIWPQRPCCQAARMSSNDRRASMRGSWDVSTCRDGFVDVHAGLRAGQDRRAVGRGSPPIFRCCPWVRCSSTRRPWVCGFSSRASACGNSSRRREG